MSVRRFQLTSRAFAQLLIGHVQITLRLLNAGVPKHQLNDADVHAVSQEAARALVTQVVPMQVDLLQLGAVDASTGLCTLGAAP